MNTNLLTVQIWGLGIRRLAKKQFQVTDVNITSE